MLASHGMHTFVLLAAVTLSACGDKSYEAPDSDSTAYTPPRCPGFPRCPDGHCAPDRRSEGGHWCCR